MNFKKLFLLGEFSPNNSLFNNVFQVQLHSCIHNKNE